MIGKRQLILCALVCALGAAIYLNWQAAGGTLNAVGTDIQTNTQENVGAITNNQNTTTSPKTGDNITMFCLMFAISLVGIVVTTRKIMSKLN